MNQTPKTKSCSYNIYENIKLHVKKLAKLSALIYCCTRQTECQVLSVGGGRTGALPNT